MGERRVVVIGAGVGGLAAAARLAAAGVETVVLERAAGPGGKMREVSVAGRTLDAGPTVLTLREVFEDLFAACGARLDEHLRLTPIDRLARHYWTDGSEFDLHADPGRAEEEVAAFAGPAEARAFRAFRKEAARIYRAVEEPFVKGPRPSLLGLSRRVGPAGLAALGLSPFRTLGGALERRFRDRRLAQLFARYATYCGASPFAAPATLMLIAHVEMQGVWLVEGGMRRLAQALEAVAAARGARFRYGAHVERLEVEGGRVSGVRLAGGERIAADLVVSNADAGALGAGLFGEPAARAAAPVARERRTISALVWSAATEPQGKPLIRHTVCFDAADYRDEFDAIYRRRRLPERPTVYLCAQDRGEDDASPGGPERLHLHVNAPPDGDRPEEGLTEREIDLCEARTLSLMARCGVSLSLARETTLRTTPQDFEALFPGTGGSLFGPTTHGPFGVFRRPGARSRLPGLYLAGGSVHPGAGVPMAATSGRLAAEAALADMERSARSRRAAASGASSSGGSRRASTSPARPAAISGGISTRSPTTAATD